MARNNSDRWQRLTENLSVGGLLLHPATLFVAVSMATIVGAIHLWNQYQTHIVDLGQYQLTREKIRLNMPQEWTETDLKQVVLEVANPDHPATLLDPKLVPNTVQAFQKIGWVESVRQVTKSRAGLDIQLAFRQPVGMVELNRLTIPDWPSTQEAVLLPVDRNGIIMPGKLVATKPLLRISIFNPSRATRLENWTSWPDQRVHDAAAIGAVLQSKWQALGLYRIVTFRKPGERADSGIPFELWPEHGTQVIWGNRPGEEVEGEATAQEKLEALEAFVAQNGPLNRLADQKIDLRQGNAILRPQTKTARLESLNAR